MLLKDIVSEDFCNYKKPSMFIIFPKCTFKCDKENGTQLCQNWELTYQEDKEVNLDNVIKFYINNTITKAVVMGGLEPFDSWDDVSEFVKRFREICDDDIVIYTGYTEDECTDKVSYLKMYKNIIIKFGRYKPNQQPHFDSVLGVQLASSNQYAKVIS